MIEMLVNVDVANLESAERFYTRAFGLSVGRRFGPHAVELTGGGSKLYLLTKAAGSHPVPGMESTRDYGRHWTPIHLDFVVDALDSALARALAAGARQESGIREY